MRLPYLKLTILVILLDPLEAAKRASGLLREGMQDARQRKIRSTTDAKGKGSDGTEIQSATSSSGKGNKGKGSSSNDVPSATEPQSCDCVDTKDSCTESEPGHEVQCFDVITDHRVLKTSLGCLNNVKKDSTGNKSFQPVLTVQGPDGVLECSGNGDNLIYDPTPSLSSTPSVGVRLVGGGRLVNCHIAGFQTGVEMVGEGDNSIVGTHIFNVQYGIETGGVIDETDMSSSVGNYSVDRTTITGAQEEGILVRHGGQMIMSGTSVLDAHSVGIHYAPRTMSGGLYASLSKVNVFSTNNNDAVGILVGDNAKFVAHDNVYLQIFELSKVIGSGAEGFVQSATPLKDHSIPELVTEVVGTFDVQASTLSGIFVESGTFISADGSLISSCTSGVSNDDSETILVGVVPDIFITFETDPVPRPVNNGIPQCNRSLPDDLGCIGGCSGSIGTALACQRRASTSEAASEAQTVTSSGKGKGGKGSVDPSTAASGKGGKSGGRRGARR